MNNEHAEKNEHYDNHGIFKYNAECGDKPLKNDFLISTIIMREYWKSVEKGAYHDMSFVGIVVLENALLAFGDSRSVLTDRIGNIKIEEGRTVQKVFRINDEDASIFVTHGVNKIKSRNGNVINLEDFLNRALRNGMKMSEIISELTMSFDNNREYYEDNKLYLMTGGKDDRGIFVRNIEISSDGVFTSHKYRNGYYTNVINVYTPWFKNKFNYYLMRSSEPESVKKMIKEELELEIRRCDEEYFVNPVGLPLQFEIIKF